MTSAYDQLNPWGPDYDYWLALTDRLQPRTITDLGCGTGQLTVLFARQGHATVGIDPDPEMLAVARARDGHECVTWLEGYVDDLPSDSADLITMTSHVSQVFLEDSDWSHALEQMHRVLVSGGRIAFDMRNPIARGWEAWNPKESLRTYVGDDGPTEVWHEVTNRDHGLVTFATTERVVRTGESITAIDTLCFRGEERLRETLSAAGFGVETVHGDWDGSDVTSGSPELIVVAQRRP